MNERCIVRKCKDCSEQIRCFGDVGCEHNYILIKSETTTSVYKCSKCGKKIRESKIERNNCD